MNGPSTWDLSCIPAFPSSVLMANSLDGCLQRAFLTLTGCSTLAPTSTWQGGTALSFTLHKPNRRRARPTIAAAPSALSYDLRDSSQLPPLD